MKLTAEKRRVLKKNLAVLDKTQLLEGLDRTHCNRNAGFPLLTEALDSVGLALSMVNEPLTGDHGHKALAIECAFTGETVDNAGVSYAWHWCERANGTGGYEIVAYIS